MTKIIKREKSIILKDNKGSKKGFIRKVRKGPECKLVNDLKATDYHKILTRSKLA